MDTDETTVVSWDDHILQTFLICTAINNTGEWKLYNLYRMRQWGEGQAMPRSFTLYPL